MDRVIKKKLISKKLKGTIILIVIIIIFVRLFINNYTPTYTIKRSELILSQVTEKSISKSIMANGVVESINNIILESSEAGVITKILGVSGKAIKKDQIIIIMTNENLNQELISITELLEKQTIQYAILVSEFSAKEVDHSEEILELEYKIEQLKLDVIINKKLYASSRIAKNTFDQKKKEYNFWSTKKALRQQKWERLQNLQLSNLELLQLEINSTNRKINNLKKRTNRLIIKAPKSGILNLEKFDIGQNINVQEKLGVIDRQDGFKLVANIDEFYIQKLTLGDKAFFEEHELEISFISPKVINKKVKIEFKFISQMNTNIKSGQSFNIKIIQGIPEVRNVIESGSYIKESGGNWIFKVIGNKAIRIPIELGIKTNEYNEIISGINIGDKVIISSYKKFKKYKLIHLEE